MAEPTAWSLEEETEASRLRMALTDAQADLQRRDAALLKLQRELLASRVEVAGARGETVQFQGLLRRAEEVAQACIGLEAAIGGRDAEITQLHAVIAALQTEVSTLRAGMNLLRASASWRISAPVRVAGRLMRGIHTTGPGVSRASASTDPHQPMPTAQPTAALSSPGDPNSSAVFQVTPLPEHPSDETEGAVTLDALYYLSRSL